MFCAKPKKNRSTYFMIVNEVSILLFCTIWSVRASSDIFHLERFSNIQLGNIKWPIKRLFRFIKFWERFGSKMVIIKIVTFLRYFYGIYGTILDDQPPFFLCQFWQSTPPKYRTEVTLFLDEFWGRKNIFQHFFFNLFQILI